MTKYTYSEWIDHDGKGMPVDGDVLVAVKFKDGDEDFINFPIRAEYWHSDNEGSNWVASNTDDDDALITAYRIATPINEQETIDEG